MSDKADAILQDLEAFARLMREEPCELYAHAWRRAANGLIQVVLNERVKL